MGGAERGEGGLQAEPAWSQMRGRLRECTYPGYGGVTLVNLCVIRPCIYSQMCGDIKSVRICKDIKLDTESVLLTCTSPSAVATVLHARKHARARTHSEPRNITQENRGGGEGDGESGREAGREGGREEGRFPCILPVDPRCFLSVIFPSVIHSIRLSFHLRILFLSITSHFYRSWTLKIAGPLTDCSALDEQGCLP